MWMLGCCLYEIVTLTRPFDGIKILEHMKSVIKNPLKNLVITDLTGNVGGDTILFGLNFKFVHSIELKDDNFEALQNNVNVYHLSNVELHKGDSTKIYRWKTDVLYMDPPWGGPDYKKYDKLDLYLGKIRVDKLLKYVLKQEWKPSYIFMKLPSNYNFARLDKLVGDKYKLHTWDIRGYKLVCIELI